MTSLSPEQRHAIGEAGDKPLPVEDPETHQAYFIIRAELYNRIRAILEEEVEEVDPSFFEIDDFEPAPDDPAHWKSYASSANPPQYG